MSRFNQILAALFAAQAVALLIMGATSSDGPAQQTTKQFFSGLDADKVTEIEILGAPQAKPDDPPQDKVVLAKTGGNWGIATADGFPVETSKVDELIESLVKLKSRNQVLESSTYHEKLEVAPDKFQRKVTVTADGKKTVLYIGSAPKFKNVHVRLDGEDGVYLVSDFGSSQVGARAWNWVSRDYVKVPADEVWQVKIKNQKGEIQLDKDPVSKEWAVLGLNKPLDKSTVDDVVRKASTVSLEAPVGKKVESSYGFDSPSATVTLVTGTSTIAGTPPPTTETVTWQIGKKIDSANQYFAKASTSDYVVKLAGWAVQPLVEKATADLAEQKDK